MKQLLLEVIHIQASRMPLLYGEQNLAGDSL